MNNEKVILVIGEETKQFDNIGLAKAYLRENGIRNVKFETIPSEPIVPPNIENYLDTYELMPSIPMPIELSGQKRRRERRAKERKKKQ